MAMYMIYKTNGCGKEELLPRKIIIWPLGYTFPPKFRANEAVYAGCGLGFSEPAARAMTKRRPWRSQGNGFG
jgi:hypothetical protein